MKQTIQKSQFCQSHLKKKKDLTTSCVISIPNINHSSEGAAVKTPDVMKYTAAPIVE